MAFTRIDLEAAFQPPSPSRDDPVEPPTVLPLAEDDMKEHLRQVILDHWSSIQTVVARGSVQTRYNYYHLKVRTCAFNICSTVSSTFRRADDHFQEQLELRLYTEAQAHESLLMLSRIAELLRALLGRTEPDR